MSRYVRCSFAAIVGSTLNVIVQGPVSDGVGGLLWDCEPPCSLELIAAGSEKEGIARGSGWGGEGGNEVERIVAGRLLSSVDEQLSYIS